MAAFQASAPAIQAEILTGVLIRAIVVDHECHPVMPFPSTTNTSKAERDFCGVAVLGDWPHNRDTEIVGDNAILQGPSGKTVCILRRKPAGGAGPRSDGVLICLPMSLRRGPVARGRTLGSSASSGVTASPLACFVQVMFGFSFQASHFLVRRELPGNHDNGIRGLNSCLHRLVDHRPLASRNGLLPFRAAPVRVK